MVSYEVLTFQPGGYEPVGPERGHERSTWMTPLGPFEVEQEYGRRPADGRTLITGPAELQAALAWRFGRQRSYLRIGVELHLDGHAGALLRPTFGLGSARRQLQVRFEHPRPSWSVRARARRFELSRGTQVVGRHGGVTELAADASPQDAAMAILLAVNDVGAGAAFWSRILSLLDGV